MSTLPEITDEELEILKGKTLIVTGGASGIGKAVVLIAHGAGANVVIADVNTADGEPLVADLQERAIFVYTDIASWDSVLALFATASERFKSIDAVYANAGVHFGDNLLEDEFDKSGKLNAPSLKSVEINLHGALYTTKAAIHFFGKDPSKKHQLVLTGSAASLIDTPPLFMYCAAKAGVLGLMRGLRSTLPAKNITINMIAPWMTVTPLLPQWIRDLWGDLPANDPHGVAKALLIPMVRPNINGRTLWVAGNNAVEVEESLHKSQPQWLGADLSKAVDEGQKRMGINNAF